MKFRYMDLNTKNMVMHSLGMECVLIESESDLQKEIRLSIADRVGIIYVSKALYRKYTHIIDSYNSNFDITITVLNHDSRINTLVKNAMGIDIGKES